ncbi:hypothetical protein BVX98_06625 [bacterium F11]|nr:hypothetical protein BVX98_06625 [bacterium F11]
MGNFSFSTLNYNLAWSKNMADWGRLGATGKIWNEDFGGSSSDGWAMDIGYQSHTLWSFFDVGAVVRNLGPKVEGDPLPQSWAVGSGMIWREVTFLSELDFASHRDTALRLGLEYSHLLFSLRGGYQNLSSDLDESISRFSFGGAFKLRGFHLDYSWSPKGDLGDEHRFSLNLSFGLTPEEKKAQALMLDQAMNRQREKLMATYLKSGKAAMAKENWEKAVQDFTWLQQWDNKNPEINKLLITARQKRKISKANAAYLKGFRLSKKGQWLEAALQAQVALDLIPTHKKAKELKRRSQEKLKAPKTDQDFDSGMRHFLNARYDKAIAKWEKALKKNPKRTEIRTYIEKAKRIRAEQRLSQIQKKEQNLKDELTNLNQKAYTLYTLGQTQEAILIWEQMLQQDPRNQEALSALKQAKKKMELMGSTEKSHASSKVERLNAQAMEAYNQGNLAKAKKLWTQALRLNPDNIWIQNNLNRLEKEMAGR